MRLLRWLLILFGSTSALAILILVAAYIYINKAYPPEKLAVLLQASIEQKLNLRVKIRQVDYTWHGRIQIQDIIILDEPAGIQGSADSTGKNAPAKPSANNKSAPLDSPDQLLGIKSLVVQISIPALLSKKIQVQALELEYPQVLLTQAKEPKKFKNRWLEILGQLPSSPGQQQVALDIENVQIRNFSLKLKAGVTRPFPDIAMHLAISLRPGVTEIRTQVFQHDQNGFITEAKIVPGISVSALSEAAAREKLFSEIDIKGKVTAEKTSGKLLSAIAGIPIPVTDLAGIISFAYTGQKLSYTTNSLGLMHKTGQSAQITSSGEYNVRENNFFSANSKISLGSAQVMLANVRKDGGQPLGFSFTLDGQIESLAKFAGLSGNNTGTAHASGKVTGKRLTQLSLRLTNFTNSTKGIDTKIPDLKADFDGKAWQIPSTEIHTMGNKLQLQVYFQQSSSPVVVQLVLGAHELELETIVNKLGQIPASTGSAESENRPFNISAKMKIGTVKYAQFKWENVQFSVESSGETVKLSSLNFRFASGNFTGKLERQLGKRYVFDVSFSGLHMHDFMKMLGATGQIRANCQGFARGGFLGESAAEIQKSLKAEARFSSGKGRISNTFLQKGYLNGPLSPLEDKLSDIEFTKSEMLLQAADGNINITKAYFEAEEWSIKAGGQTNYQLKGEGHTMLKFRETFIENVANPLQLGISDTRSGNTYTLPFSCQGNFREASCWRREW